MRLDKWLKVSLIFKQRSKAVVAIDNNRVRVNGEIAKAARNIRIGDKIDITSELGVYQYTVRSLAEKNVSREQAREMYELIKPEETGSADERMVKQLERDHKITLRKDWRYIYNDKKKQRQLRAHKYKKEQ